MTNHMTAAVSGGTSGIGRAIAQNLAQSGIQVAISGRNQDSLEQICAASQQPGGIIGVAADVRDVTHVEQLWRASEHNFGEPPSAFVLCAGRGLPGSLLTSDQAQWEELIAINVLGAMQQLRAVAKAFSERERSSDTVQDIVVIGSTVGRTLSAGNPVYGATKFALHSLVESLRQELASSLIRVTLIEPGFVRSGFQQSAGYDMNAFDTLERDLGPFLSAEDVARSISFVLDQPPHVHIDDIRLRPTRQRV
ncbi:SDR family oxidoreductase [Xanthomonas hortorum]|uniref:SDR family oxidoreductase n=1 Tax=Xanthomonas hortorum TaxID=56454 RepID=A0AA47EW45_9XANT|nr:SDR family oxidoreductase [Xanthomonas hortorum]WAH66457.1 SDR family oxidoreductase [Xanthomonas hortorum]